jgi:hypothetical protein
MHLVVRVTLVVSPQWKGMLAVVQLLSTLVGEVAELQWLALLAT